MDHDSAHLAFAQSLLVAVDFSKQSEAALVFRGSGSLICAPNSARAAVPTETTRSIRKVNGIFRMGLLLFDSPSRVAARVAQPGEDCAAHSTYLLSRVLIGVPFRSSSEARYMNPPRLPENGQVDFGGGLLTHGGAWDGFVAVFHP